MILKIKKKNSSNNCAQIHKTMAHPNFIGYFFMVCFLANWLAHIYHSMFLISTFFYATVQSTYRTFLKVPGYFIIDDT